MFIEVPLATKEYQTSSSAVPKQEPNPIPDEVAPDNVPAVWTVQVPGAEFTDAVVAEHGLSFGGGGGGADIHMF